MAMPHLNLLETVDSLEVNSVVIFCMVSSKLLATQHEFRWFFSLLDMENLLLEANHSAILWYRSYWLTQHSGQEHTSTPTKVGSQGETKR